MHTYHICRVDDNIVHYAPYLPSHLLCYFNGVFGWLGTNAKRKAMSLTLNEYRVKLIKKILYAGSREDVQWFINSAIKSVEHNKLNGHLITRFVDKMTGEIFLTRGSNCQVSLFNN